MRAPVATYRLQLSARFGFARAREVVPYLRELGVSDVYASPIFAARTGSAHGYDVTDPTRLNPELGSRADFDDLVAELRRHGMGLLLDIVPNHMAASVESPWWADVLRHGRDSAHARVFDIDWDAPGLDGRLLLPVLGAELDDVLARGELAVDADGTSLAYYESRFPLSPEGEERVRAAGGADAVNADAGLLRSVVEAQRYRLAFWRRASSEINYRRFFDISDLVGVRVEDPEVFEATHRLALELVAEGSVTGLRVDHVDGLRDPAAYLERLQERLGGDGYVVVEKILAHGERLPDGWPVAGTTGYEFLDAVGGQLEDAAGVRAVGDAASRVIGVDVPFAFLVSTSKTRAMEGLFGAEEAALVRRLGQLAEADARTAGLPSGELSLALVDVTAALPVYRTYTRGPEVAPADRAVVERAVLRASAEVPVVERPAVEFLRRTLLMDGPDETAEERLDLVLRWQQLSGPVMAKGVEDTALYVDNRLISQNEVGSHPGPPPGVDAFHALNAHRRERWPYALSTTSTHDTKRSEDVRARISVLSELPDDWSEGLGAWREAMAGARREVDGRVVPGPNEELLLYQTLLGAWPLRAEDQPGFAARLEEFVVKAAREAKVHTSWIDPDEAYEAALVAFAAALVDQDGAFWERFAPLGGRVAWYGALNALAQVLLKIASPGVPDLYQGTELWNLRLVDPDNRAPVDWERRRGLLADLRRAGEDRRARAAELLAAWPDGRIKLWVTHAALALRRDEPGVFLDGDYLPLAAHGARAGHVTAFARRSDAAWAVAVAPRLPVGLADVGVPPLGAAVWGETAIPLPPGAPGRFVDVLTGAEVEARDGGEAGPALLLADVLATLPVALLRAAVS